MRTDAVEQNRALKAELQRRAVAPEFAEERRVKNEAKLTRRMKGVVVEIKKKRVTQ